MRYPRGTLLGARPGATCGATPPADDHNPAAALLEQMVRVSHKDVARVVRLGERASPAQLRDLEEAERFLKW